MTIVHKKCIRSLKIFSLLQMVSVLLERVEFKRCIFSVLYHLCPKFGKEDKVKCKLGQFKIIT